VLRLTFEEAKLKHPQRGTPRLEPGEEAHDPCCDVHELIDAQLRLNRDHTEQTD